MTVEIQVSGNDYRAVVEHVNPNSLENDNVIVSGESQQKNGVHRPNSIGVYWGTSMMRVINLGKPITGPGYYPGPSPAFLPEQVAFVARGPGYYSCATPKVFIYKLTGGHPGGNRYPIAFFNTKEEAEKIHCSTSQLRRRWLLRDCPHGGRMKRTSIRHRRKYKDGYRWVMLEDRRPEVGERIMEMPQHATILQALHECKRVWGRKKMMGSKLETQEDLDYCIKNAVDEEVKLYVVHNALFKSGLPTPRIAITTPGYYPGKPIPQEPPRNVGFAKPITGPGYYPGREGRWFVEFKNSIRGWVLLGDPHNGRYADAPQGWEEKNQAEEWLRYNRTQSDQRYRVAVR